MIDGEPLAGCRLKTANGASSTLASQYLLVFVRSQSVYAQDPSIRNTTSTSVHKLVFTTFVDGKSAHLLPSVAFTAVFPPLAITGSARDVRAD